jgi:hypothetical protein
MASDYSSFVGDTSGFKTDRKPVVRSSKHNLGAFLCIPTYCVRHENKKVQNRSDGPIQRQLAMKQYLRRFPIQVHRGDAQP